MAAGECRRRRQNQQQQKRHVGAVCSAAADCRSAVPAAAAAPRSESDTDLAHLLRTRACCYLHASSRPQFTFWTLFFFLTRLDESDRRQFLPKQYERTHIRAQQSTQDKDFCCGCIRKQKKSRERKTSNWISRQTGQIDKRIHRTLDNGIALRIIYGLGEVTTYENYMDLESHLISPSIPFHLNGNVNMLSIKPDLFMILIK